MNDFPPLILGTAGHIDHGKTTLIRALTGIDTDRLPEERERGISIALGYARLQLPSGRNLSVIDVPGHERFVRTMVAGATGIDMYLMAVAADDGVMPQTREHAAVLRALNIQRGVVAVTRSDLGSAEPALGEARALMPEGEFVAVSARTGAGLTELLAALERVAAGVTRRRANNESARLHVDRVFTVHGAGAVVTGTLWSGSLSPGMQVDVLPAGARARVRGIEVHGEPVELAQAGERVALNLAGKAARDLGRGDVVATHGSDLAATYRLDCELQFSEREATHGERVQIHHGTRESSARLAWLGGRFWQLRLEQPLIAAAGDRLVVRQIAPPDTLGGGVVLDSRPRKHGPGRDLLVHLQGLSRAGAPPAPAAARHRPVRPRSLTAPEVEPLVQLTESALALERCLREAQLEPPSDFELDAADLSALRTAGRAVRVAKGLHYHPDTLAEVRGHVLELAGRHGGTVTLAQLRDHLGTSRKFAQALLEHMDRERVTIRRGETHHLRKSSLPAAAD